MPLPHLPGYRPRLQSRVDRRRVVLAGMLFGFFAVLLMVLGHRAARSPGSSLNKTMSADHVMVVMFGVGFCGSWGETMRQLSLVARNEQARKSLE